MKAFSKGARVCFVGDSLVAMNQTLPRIIDYYNKFMPEREVVFFNCGTSGGTCKSAIDYFYDDVLVHKPTHAVIAFGVNDSDRGSLQAERDVERYNRLVRAYEEYKENIKNYTQILQENGIEVVLCTPAIYDEYTKGSLPALKGGYALILGYAEFIRSFAKEKGYPLCDYHKFLTKVMQEDEAKIYTDDRVHPNEHGFYLMAKCFLAFQGIEIGKEETIPEYLDEWIAEVGKLRKVFGAEHMIIRNYQMPLAQKMAMIQEKVDKEDWGQPVFESFIRNYLVYKPLQSQLYENIDRIYNKMLIDIRR